MRLISSIILLAIVIPVFIIGDIFYTIGIIAVSMLALKEYIDIKETKKELPIFIKLIAYLLMPLILLSINTDLNSKLIIDFRILTGLCLTMFIPIVLYHKRELYSINDACYMFAGVLFLGISMSFFLTYYQISNMLLLYLLMITVFTDTFAYLTGMLIGRNKLLEDISPKKTWEGFFGGAILGSFISIVFYQTIVNPDVTMSNLVLITVFLSVIGQLGDLFFSAIKRYFGQKDFSNLLPGHGGILDRLDSSIFVMLAFSMFITLL
jgi:phosphatidate cytidylyltransferase